MEIMVEKIINVEINFYLEVNIIIIPEQFEIRRRHNTALSALKIANKAKLAFNKKLVTPAVFLDI